MVWTAEATEVLKRLALEGRSASAIAAALGAASRSAVIGKANRIGIRLNGDGRASALDGAPARMNRMQLALPQPEPAPGRPSALRREPKRKEWSFAEDEVEEMRRVRFEEIREYVCRWPLGDPMSNDFAYCGLMTAKGHSYCDGHCRMAYQPPRDRTRQAPRERQWSRALANPWRLR